MDEALLSRTAAGEESSRPSPRREFTSSLLDLGSPWRQSTARIITTDAVIPIITTPNSSFANLISNLNRKRNLTHRSHSAPSVFTDVKEAFPTSADPRPSRKSMPLIVRQEAVMMSTVDLNQFNTMVRTYMIDTEKGRMRIRIKVGLALAVVVVCIAVGTIGIHLLEGLTWVDSIYLSVTSVTTVGYGDYAFETLAGRCFAIIWLLVSTLAVARAFLYLTELRIDKRNRRIAKWVLQKKLTLGDLVAADLDNDGSISKSEFVIYKLKEMGKISEKDILLISKQFESLDHTNCGKITIADLMDTIQFLHYFIIFKFATGPSI
ncbi:unnamed protein product, partial [Vitis vinifera]